MAPIPRNNISRNIRSIFIRSGPGEARGSANLPVWFWLVLAVAGASFLAFIIAKSVMLCRGQKSGRHRDSMNDTLIEAGTIGLQEPIPKPPRAYSRPT